MMRFSKETLRYLMHLKPREREIWFNGLRAAREYHSHELAIAKKFARTNSAKNNLFERALEIHDGKKQLTPGKNPFTFGQALTEANNTLKVFSRQQFDEQFVELEQDFKTWRSRRKKIGIAKR